MFSSLYFRIFCCFLFARSIYGDVCDPLSEERAITNDSYYISKLMNKDNINYCSCDGKPCIRKCCQTGYHLDFQNCVKNGNSSVSESNDSINVDLNFPVPLYEERNSLESREGHFHLVEGLMVCSAGYFRLTVNETYAPIFVQANGRLIVKEEVKKEYASNYCVEYNSRNQFLAIICLTPVPVGQRVNGVGMLISIPFLLATFLVYLIIPERNLHGKCLMCYVITLCFAYILLVTLQLHGHLETVPCITMGVLCLFFFLVSFFWMNVMCIDIWWTFSGLRGFSGSKKEAEQKRFILYSGYAWGVPLLIIGLVLILRFGGFVDEKAWYNPGIGLSKCWFSGQYQDLLYFYGPLGVLITVNIILFTITAFKIQQVNKDTAVLRKDENKRHSYESDKQRFNLYVKLLIAMGINWSLEVISFLVNWLADTSQEIWYLTDFCNACYGVFIFFVFVFKKNIWLLLKKRYYMIIGKPYMARIVTQSAPRTTTSTLSYGNTNTTETPSVAP